MRTTRTVGAVLACALPLAGLAGLGNTSPAVAASNADDETAMFLVTLAGPGTSSSTLPPEVLSLWMRTAQDQVLGSVDAGEPTYRWTTALSGVAVELTDAQADELATDPRVALVERDRLLHLAGTATPSAATATAPRTKGGGTGTVIGFVDSGITPEGSVFAAGPGLGSVPDQYAGECRTAPDWPDSACTGKVVGAQWFVDGFGADRLRDASSMSARDDDGHGTAVASVAAGNDGLTARVRGQRLGRFAGVAPDAWIAVYKACWTAPDPDRDGCAASDVVSAIDRATADGVDVLNLSVVADSARDATEDTVLRALLGAAEAGIAVVGAAGNGPGEVGYAVPWVTSVGAVTGDVRRGLVERRGAPALRGVMVSDRTAGPARLVLGEDVAAVGSDRRDARLCVPGSLDAAEVGGRIVLCERGGVGRTDKSLAVRQADGIGMVLANEVTGSLDADLHVVPTVHVDADEGATLRRWLAHHPHGRVTLTPRGVQHGPARVAGWSRTGDARLGVAAPDVLAEGSGVLAATSADSGPRWQLVSGTSVAAAQVSGLAASLISRRGWSANTVRSALAGTAIPVPGSRSGAGLVRRDPSTATLGVRVTPGDYRGWLDGRRVELGTATLLLDRDRRTVTRTVTNLSGRTRTFTARVTGLPGLTLAPVSLRLAPGQSADVTIRMVGARSGRGLILWRDGSSVAARWPVLAR